MFNTFVGHDNITAIAQTSCFFLAILRQEIEQEFKILAGAQNFS